MHQGIPPQLKLEDVDKPAESVHNTFEYGSAEYPYKERGGVDGATVGF